MDAAILLDVIAGSSPEDLKTAIADEHIPANGYAAALDENALNGKRIGLYGPGWRPGDAVNGGLSEEAAALYQAALAELEARGAILIEDPFEGSNFSALAYPDPDAFFYDHRGTESVAHDFHNYIQRLGLESLDDFKTVVGATPFEEGEPLYWYVLEEPILAESVTHPADAPDLTEFFTLRQQYLDAFNAVMEAHDLDALVFPQSFASLPTRESDEFYSATTVSEVNIAGLPAITVPAGQYGDNSPFGLIFVGRQWSEALLLSLAYDYEQATGHRIVPTLTQAAQ